MALFGADHGDPEARAGAYLLVEFLGGFRSLLKGLSAKPSSPTPARRNRRG